MGFINIIEKVVGTYSHRELKRIKPILEKIIALDEKMSQKSDSELREMTDTFKARLKSGETLDDILPEAFAVCREASQRVLGMKHFPVQIIGGIVLHQGRIAEMKTGEGKTLVATLPAYLNALSGKGVHIVTVNDYLAKRDSEWMGKLYNFLGISVGLVIHEKDNDQRREAYNADITYGTNNELGFDYLRDNMVIYKEDRVQRGHSFAIVDEVDSILIDEARTPLIISGMGEKSTALYEQADLFAKKLTFKRVAKLDTKEDTDDIYADVDYIVDEQGKTATLTAAGIQKAEKAFNVENLTDLNGMTISHYINQAIKANGVMSRDKDYVVQDGEVIIVDEFTGRLMYGRRYNDGLHQAIEAKERVKIENESKTLATITFQNFFRLYNKLSGMTGTAQTEEKEFQEIYKLDVVEIPTNRPMQRTDYADCIFKTEQDKFNAVLTEIENAHQKGQPVLIGTASIEKSEILSKMLKRKGIKHNVLNAKLHEKEAEIVAQAGKKGAVTIATNMAGRGTDVILGGNAEYMAKQQMKKMGFTPDLIVQSTGFAETYDEEIINVRNTFAQLNKKYKAELEPEQSEVLNAGGLYIIGTEKHESRRIDNQLRGRAGRQGDIGMSRFFLSLEDELMRLFASDKISRIMETSDFEDGKAIENKAVSSSVETAQTRVENNNFEIRKHILKYDDVNNKQREMIYSQRNDVLNGADLKNTILKMIESVIKSIISCNTNNCKNAEEWQWDLIRTQLTDEFGAFEDSAFDFDEYTIDRMTVETATEHFAETAKEKYKKQEELFGDNIREIERIILLQEVDAKWMEHIDNIEQLRQGITLRAYAQRDPIIEYKFEAMDMFDEMISSIKTDTIKMLFHIVPQNEIERKQLIKPMAENLGSNNPMKKSAAKEVKTGRNEPCPCGSGKKYKHCCIDKER